MGNKDIEDSLERLDKLTQEEARMASVEQLKMTYSVDDRVRGVEGQVQDVHDDVRDVGNKVQHVKTGCKTLAKIFTVGFKVSTTGSKVLMVN